ncbi:hypothetical protein QOT17_001054 [Balamuthia mandrillaris]
MSKRPRQGVTAAVAASTPPSIDDEANETRDVREPSEPDERVEKRLQRNRKAAQLFRRRQKQYIKDLEKRVEELNCHNAQFLSEERLLLIENRLIKEQLAYLRDFVNQVVAITRNRRNASGAGGSSFTAALDSSQLQSLLQPFHASITSSSTSPPSNNNNNNKNNDHHHILGGDGSMPERYVSDNKADYYRRASLEEAAGGEGQALGMASARNIELHEYLPSLSGYSGLPPSSSFSAGVDSGHHHYYGHPPAHSHPHSHSHMYNHNSSNEDYSRGHIMEERDRDRPHLHQQFQQHHQHQQSQHETHERRHDHLEERDRPSFRGRSMYMTDGGESGRYSPYPPSSSSLPSTSSASVSPWPPHAPSVPLLPHPNSSSHFSGLIYPLAPSSPTSRSQQQQHPQQTQHSTQQRYLSMEHSTSPSSDSSRGGWQVD